MHKRACTALIQAPHFGSDCLDYCDVDFHSVCSLKLCPSSFAFSQSIAIHIRECYHSRYKCGAKIYTFWNSCRANVRSTVWRFINSSIRWLVTWNFCPLFARQFYWSTYSIEQFSIMIMLNTIVRTILRHNWMRQAAEVTINEFDVYAWLFADVKVYRLFGTFSAGKMDCIGMRVTNH